MPRLRRSRGAQVADRARVGADRARARADLARARARQTAAEIAPLAKSAGDAVRQGADDVAAWAGPQVRKTRSWAAPRVERTGVMVQEKIAPQVSEALTKAARKLDPEPRRGRGLRRFLALGLAAAGAAVAVMVIRKKTGPAESEPDYTPDFTSASETGSSQVPEGTPDDGTAETSRVDSNGHIRSTP